VTTRIFADAADLDLIASLVGDGRISGFTTNPTLMRKAGLSDYAEFARQVLDKVTDLPVSFEVVADDLDGMRHEGAKISTWGDNVYVKIPITTTAGESTAPVVRALSSDGVKVNVTAIFTPAQVEVAAFALQAGAPSNVSVFAGRIADAGTDPVPIVARAVEIVSEQPSIEVIWASPREVLNVVQAGRVGCHIITMTPDLLAKLDLIGTDLDEYSLETVRMFHRDAVSAGLEI
jgi:transaldolase